MGKKNHDELMARARTLNADSQKDTVRRVWQDVLEEVNGLKRALASHLRRNGVPTSRERDGIMREALDTFDADAYFAGHAPYPTWRLSDVELAELVADGSIRLDDKRIKTGSWLARKLRAATVEAARLELLLYPQATPLVIPEDLNPYPAGQDRDPRIGRAAYCIKYAWAIPSEEALATIGALGPIVEIGAGSGYWAQLLRERGTDVAAFDLEPNPVRNGFISWQWGPVRKAPATAASQYPDRTLLLIWPSYESPMAHEALQSYRGDRVVYIGEGWGGCTADDSFHQLLDDEWDEVQEVSIPQWDGLHDYLTVYRRR